MVFVFVKRANALAINQDNLQRLTLVDSLQQLCPAPQAFRARLNCGPDTKAPLLTRIDDDPVEQERLASAILAGDANDANGLFYARQKLFCFLTH